MMVDLFHLSEKAALNIIYPLPLSIMVESYTVPLHYVISRTDILPRKLLDAITRECSWMINHAVAYYLCYQT